jgi:hypothetical protein
MVNKQKRKSACGGQKLKNGKYLTAFGFTSFTTSLNGKLKQIGSQTWISSRKEGVASSQERDIKG